MERAVAGVGLRARHVAEVIADRPPVAWFEVHPENYMMGGPALRALVDRLDPVRVSDHELFIDEVLISFRVTSRGSRERP